jgi:type VI protein secretion system component Hcp
MLAYVEFGKPVDDYFAATSYSVGTGVGSSGLAGGGSVTAQLHGMQFTKNRDSLSDAIVRHCAAGTVFDTVWVELCRDADSEVYLTYTLGGVQISSVHSGGSGESVGLDYKTSTAVYAGR